MEKYVTTIAEKCKLKSLIDDARELIRGSTRRVKEKKHSSTFVCLNLAEVSTVKCMELIVGNHGEDWDFVVG